MANVIRLLPHCNAVATSSGIDDRPQKPRYQLPYAACHIRRRWPSLSPSVARLYAEQAGLGGVE